MTLIKCDHFDNFTLLLYNKLQCTTHKEQRQLQEKNPGHLIMTVTENMQKVCKGKLQVKTRPLLVH